MEPAKCDAWAQAIVGIAPYFILGIMGPLLVWHGVDSSAHDIVLSIVTGVLGAAVGPHASAAATTSIKAALSTVPVNKAPDANPPS